MKIFKLKVGSSKIYELKINEKNNEINKLKEQIEKYRYSRDDKQTLYR